MRQQDVFKKIGNILQELNEQYDYLKTQTDNIDDLELELFAANTHFLSDHVEILRKLNIHLAKSLPPHQQNTETQPATNLLAAQPELVVEPPVAFVEQVPEQQIAEAAAPTLEEYYDIEEPAGEEHGTTTPEFVFDFNNPQAGPQEEQDLAAEPQYELAIEEEEETLTEPEYQTSEPEQTVETYEPPYQPEEPVEVEAEQPTITFEEPEVEQEDAKAEEAYLFHIHQEETTPEVDEPEQDIEEVVIPEKAPELFSFEIPTKDPEPEITIAPETSGDTFSFIRTEPEVVGEELTLNEADTWASDDEDQPGTINAAYRQPIAEQQPERTPLQEQTFAEPEPDAPETIVTPEVEPTVATIPEPPAFVPVPTYVPTPEPIPTFQLNRQTEPLPAPEPQPAHEPERPLTLNERISAQLANNNNATTSPAIQPIKDLKSAITLNDKMLFVRDLFNGYSLAYSEAIEILNRFNNFDDAERFLNSNYVEKNHWAEKQGTTEKFFELLKRRFT